MTEPKPPIMRHFTSAESMLMTSQHEAAHVVARHRMGLRTPCVSSEGFTEGTGEVIAHWDNAFNTLAGSVWEWILHEKHLGKTNAREEWVDGLFEGIIDSIENEVGSDDEAACGSIACEIVPIEAFVRSNSALIEELGAKIYASGVLHSEDIEAFFETRELRIDPGRVMAAMAFWNPLLPKLHEIDGIAHSEVLIRSKQ